jgi:hypothetical protein
MIRNCNRIMKEQLLVQNAYFKVKFTTSNGQ